MVGAELQTEFFISPLADDPDLRSLVELFVQELPERLAKIRTAAYSEHFQEVGRLAHQLKGAGGSYGFPQLSDAALALERAARVTQSSADVWRALDWLAAVCERSRVD